RPGRFGGRGVQRGGEGGQTQGALDGDGGDATGEPEHVAEDAPRRRQGQGASDRFGHPCLLEPMDRGNSVAPSRGKWNGNSQDRSRQLSPFQLVASTLKRP